MPSINNFMKQLICILSLFFALTVHAQNLSGKYYSTETSFQDLLDPENSFKSKAKIMVNINYDSNTKSGNYITICDPESPKIIHKYQLSPKAEKMPPSKYYLSSYVFKNSFSETSKSNLDIVIYYNNENKLNVMLTGKEKSQALKELVKINP